MYGHVHRVWGRLAEARCSHCAPRIGHPPGPCAVRTAVTWARRFPLCQSHPDVGGWTISRPLRQRSPKSRHGRSSGDEPRGKASLRSVHTAVTGPACPHALMPMHAVWPTARPEPRSVGVKSAERSARRLRHSSGDRGLHQFDDFLLYRGAPLLHRERHGPQVPVVEGRSVLDSSVEYRVLNLPEFLKLTTTLPSALA